MQGAGENNFGFDGILGDDYQFSDDEEELAAIAAESRLTKIHSQINKVQKVCPLPKKAAEYA